MSGKRRGAFVFKWFGMTRRSGGGRRGAALVALLAVVVQVASARQQQQPTTGQPTLADVWAGRAGFVPDGRIYGGPFGMHYISTWPQGSQIWTYYIAPNGGADKRMAIGLALTSDGVNFSNQGTVIHVGPQPWDNNMASFPGVLKLDGGRWAVVYEGDGQSSPSDVGLATSSDGRVFVKEPAPILVHATPKPGDPAGLNLLWEESNIGTPSLFTLNGVHYLFYHGFGRSWDGGPNDCQLGVATGTDLRQLRRYSGNPVLRTGPAGAWDSGTVGKRSVRRDADGWFYMVYEGSTDQPYETAHWSSGLARSRDLLHWEKFPGNPVLPQTTSGFGYDGPEWLTTPDGRLHIYFRHITGPTSRATLSWVSNATRTTTTENVPPATAPESSPQVFDSGPRVFEAEKDLAHQVGRAEADGWSARVGDKPEQYMSFGPYTTAVAPGPRTAVFRLMLDNVTADDSLVLKIEVYDSVSRNVLAVREISRRQFARPLTYQDFTLGFQASAGQRLEFRTFWYGRSYARQDRVTVR